VIDKLVVRIPEFALPGPILKGPLEELRRHPVPLFRPSRYYQYVCDLREPFNIDAVVHLYLRFGRPNHKVEIIDTGEKTLDEMACILTQLFAVDPWGLEIMRIDLAADIEGTPVPWFKDHAYVNRKQFSSRIEKSFEQEIQFIGMGTATAQTLYAGKRPCLMRIYDKLAEWRRELRKIESEYRRFNARMDGMDMTDEQMYYGQLVAPTFEQYCKARGYLYQPGSILTRIERQIGGNRISPEVRTVGDLRYAHELYPFAGLRIMPGADEQIPTAPPEGASLRNWLAALGFERLKERLGSAQLAHSVVLKYGKGNGKRILESLAECRPSGNQALTLDAIQESYRRSTMLQTSNSSEGGIYLSPTYEREIT
jgi:hypothetical protein